MMKKLVLGAVAATAVLAAAPAHATLVSYTASGTTSSADPSTGFGVSAFSDSGIGAGKFTDTLTFTTGITGASSASILISAFSSHFSSFTATLNGNLLAPVFTSSSLNLYSVDLASLTAGTQTLLINGISKGSASYSGSITAPVPEPSTWALSILGFGLIGGMLRSRRQAGRTTSGALLAA